MNGIFEDLIPNQPAQTSGGLFDDLVPTPAPAAPEGPDELGVGQELRGVGRALKRGALLADQGLTTLGADLNTRNQRTALDELNDATRALADFDRQAAGDPAFGTSGARWRADQEGRIAELTAEVDRRGLRTQQAFPRIARREQQAAAIPTSPDLANLHTDFWRTLATNPVETIATVVAESLPQMVPGMAAGLVAGPVGVVGGAGANSFGVEYAHSLLAAAREAGVDVTRPEQLAAFFGNAEAMALARAKAVKRGFSVAAFDTATAGVAGRFLRAAAGQGVRPVLAATGKELGTQMAGGMAGETAGQLASEGEITSVPDIVLEGIAELGSAPAEIAGNVRGELGRPRTPDSDPSRLPEPAPLNPMGDAFEAAERRRAEARPGRGMYRSRAEAAAARKLFEDIPQAPASAGSGSAEPAPGPDAQPPRRPEAEPSLSSPVVGSETAGDLTQTGESEDGLTQAAGPVATRPAVATPAEASPDSAVTTPEATPETAARKPRRFRAREVVGDILDEIEQSGGLISKSVAQKRGMLTPDRNGPEYDDVPALAHPTHNFIYGDGRGGKGGYTPDRLLRQLAEQNPRYAGMTVPDLWEAIRRASQGRAVNARATARERKLIQTEQKQQVAFENAVKPQAGDQAVNVDELTTGSTLTIDGSPFTVADIDPDTGDVILQDGPRFGRRRVEGGQTIYVESVRTPEPADDPGAAYSFGEPFRLGQVRRLAEASGLPSATTDKPLLNFARKHVRTGLQRLEELTARELDTLEAGLRTRGERLYGRDGLESRALNLSGGMNPADVRDVVARIAPKAKVRVSAEIPPTRDGRIVRGKVTAQGDITLYALTLRNRAEARAVLIEELGHLAARNPELQDLMDRLTATLTPGEIQAMRELGYGEDIAAEEAIMRRLVAEDLNAEQRTLWERIKAWLADFYRRTFGRPALESDLRDLLRAALKARNTPGSVRHSGISHQPSRLLKEAIEHFGTTRDLREAGYVLPDGTLLDLSGRHQMPDTYARSGTAWIPRPGKRDYQKGTRNVDHREAVHLESIPQGTSATDAMVALQRAGAMRVDHSGSMDLESAPTGSQYRVIQAIAEANEGTIHVDVADGDRKASFEGNAKKVIGLVRRFYQGEKMPAHQVVYSLGEQRNNQEDLFSAPESVADQKARLAREEAQAKTKADREKLVERQAKPLVGSTGDLGQGDMFGWGDLFSQPAVEPKTSDVLKSSEFLADSSARTAAGIREQVARDRENLARHRGQMTKAEIADEDRRILRWEREAETQEKRSKHAESEGKTEAARLAKQPDQFVLGAQFREPERMAKLKRDQEQAGFITLPDMARLIEAGRAVRDAIGRAGRKFSAWSAEMIRRFGKAIDGLLGMVWTRMKWRDLAAAKGVTPEAQAALNRIDELAANATDQKPEAPPVYAPEKLETWWTKLMNQSARVRYFGGDRLLKSRQELELKTALQAAAVRRSSEELQARLFEAAYATDAMAQKFPRWLAKLIPPERLRRFLRYALPIAAHLNVTGGTAGNWSFADFDMRAGFMPEAEANRQGIRTGDLVWRANPITGAVETLTLGAKLKLEDGRTGYQILRPLPADVQQQVYEQARTEFPEFMWLLDQFVDPALADTRLLVNGVQVPVFNRLALAKAYGETDPAFKAREAYTPDVAISGAFGALRRYLRARQGSLSGALNAGTVSPGRKYETGEARERGFTQDLLSGFNVRAFQVLQEAERKAWREAVLNNAEPLPDDILPHGWITVDNAFGQLWDAVKILRAFDDPINFRETTTRIRDDESPEYKQFFGELMRLRGERKMLPEALVKQLIGDLAIQRTDGIARQLASWWGRNWKAGLLLMPDTFVENRTDNYLRFLMAGWRQVIAAALRGGDALAFNEARKLVLGAVVNVVPGVRQAFDLNRNRLFEAFKTQVLPDEVFAGQTRLVDLGLDQDRPLDKLKRGEIGPAILEATGYGQIDVAAKQQFAFQLIQAKAEQRAREAGLRGDAFEAAVESYALNPPDDVRLRAVDAANRNLLNYSDTPHWLARFSRNPFGNLLVAFPLYRYHFIGREIDRATRAFRAFYSATVRRKQLSQAERAAALADTISYVTLPIMGYGVAKVLGALADSVIRDGLDDDSDDDPRRLVGASSVIVTDPETGETSRRPLPRDLVTANRLNVSEMLRQAGLETADDQDLWWHYKDYPLVRSAALFYASAEDARRHGAGQGMLTLFGGMRDLLASLTGTGQAVKVPAKLLAEIEGGSEGRPVTSLVDPYSTAVPLDAYLTLQALNLVPFNRQADEVLKWLDPNPRRITRAKTLGYDPGVSEALRLGGVTGLAAELAGQRDDLPPKGKINRRLGLVEEPVEISLAQRIAMALGQNVKPLNRREYQEALDE